MKRSTDRILTTHCGSLPRPRDLLDLMKAKVNGEPYDQGVYDARLQKAVAEIVRKQAETGIDVPTDGEQGKPGFFAYVRERLAGFEPKPGSTSPGWAAEVAAFPEYYKQYFSQAMLGGSITGGVRLRCTGSVSYRGQEAVRRDIENLKAALAGVTCEEAFMPAVAPSGVGFNEHYRSDEEYFHAVAEAMGAEYRAIVEAGFVVQIDDPFLTDLFADPALRGDALKKKAEMYVEAVNHGLRGISPEKVRFHTCYGINEGPRVHAAPLRDVVDVMLRVRAGAYSFEAANPRHEHEYHVWETVKLPAGKVLIPGVIAHTTAVVEHPETVAERLMNFARVVGRERVMAGADCGFAQGALYQRQHPTIMWAKFGALVQGARLASERLSR
jgi:5-methyltetrahydropteroyltriglutamate--homocysteine methyltransferase